MAYGNLQTQSQFQTKLIIINILYLNKPIIIFIIFYFPNSRPNSYNGIINGELQLQEVVWLWWTFILGIMLCDSLSNNNTMGPSTQLLCGWTHCIIIWVIMVKFHPYSSPQPKKSRAHSLNPGWSIPMSKYQRFIVSFSHSGFHYLVSWKITHVVTKDSYRFWTPAGVSRYWL